MNEREHDELRLTLGALALNAVPDLEARRLEHHIAVCPECAHELRLLRETAAELASLPPVEDANDLVDRISSSVPRRLSRRFATRLAVGIAAVSVIVAGVFGAALIRERNRARDLVDVVATSQNRVRLVPRKGFEGRGTVYLGRGRAALVLDAMPDPGRGRAYQLWAITDAKPVSMAVAAGGVRIRRVFDWNAPADELAVTIEPAGGSPVPTTTPVLVGG